MSVFLLYDSPLLSWEMGWMKHKLESRLLGETSINSDMQMTPPLWQKWRRTKEPLDERGEWKSWFKAQHSENKNHGILSHHFMGNRWRNSGNSGRLYFGGLQNHCKWWLQPWYKKTLTPWKKSYDQPRQHIQKQRHYFANKGPSSQDYGFSRSHVLMWELDSTESWGVKNWCFWTVALEKTLESLGQQGDPTSPS